MSELLDIEKEILKVFSKFSIYSTEELKEAYLKLDMSYDALLYYMRYAIIVNISLNEVIEIVVKENKRRSEDAEAKKE